MSDLIRHYRESPGDLLCDVLAVCLIGLALWVRLSYVWTDQMWPDEALYGWFAKRLLEAPSLLFSKEIVEFHPPLFSGMLALGQLIVPGETSLRVIPLFLNLFGIFLAYVLSVSVSGRYLGLFVILNLSFNYLFWAQATRILIDGTLTTALVFLALCLSRITGNNPRRNDIVAGSAAAVLVLLKWSGLLGALWLAAYYLWALRELPFYQRLKRLAWPLSIVALTTGFLLLNNKLQGGNFWPDTTALGGIYQAKPVGYYALNLHNIFIFPYLIPLLIYGLLRLLLRRNRPDILVLSWFVIFFAAISLAGEKVLRYSLPLIPAGLLIAGMGLEDILRTIFKNGIWLRRVRWACLGAMALTVVGLSPRLQGAVASTFGPTFVGFKEAVLWINHNTDQNALLVAGSPRIVRYYSGENFSEFGGRLRPVPLTLSEFERLVSQWDGPVVLIIDRWEAAQPGWIFPLSKEKIDNLEKLGFKQEYTVKGKNGPDIVWIFHRHP